jgi:tryptophan-rich sensory protein
MIRLKELLMFVLGTLAVGFLGSLLGNFDTYKNLIKPSFSPPSLVFPIAWTILYILMGISAYIVYMSVNKEKRNSTLVIFYVQLLVNVIWSYIFFGLGYKLLAFIWLLILLVLVIIMSIKFYKIKHIAGLLQIPYILWLMFAGILNYSIYTLNI